jgi:hypothetical protein
MRLLLFFTIFYLFLFSCKTEETEKNINWNDLKIGIINQDKILIDKEISKLLINTNPNLTTDDLIGQKDNLDKLINTINTSNLLTCELACYACIKTYPAQSEIKINTDSSGTRICRIIDLMTSNADKLSFKNIHDCQ